MRGADIQLKDLPVFVVIAGFSLVKFWKGFDRCRSAGQWENASALCHLKYCLRGTAAKEFEEAGPFDNVDQAKQVLFDKFLRDEDRWAASIQLSNLRQLQNESVTQYFHRFDDMSEVAYGDSPPLELMAIFINGLLSEDAQRVIQRQKPKTLSEALRVAKKEEVFRTRPSQTKVQNQNKNFGPNSQNIGGNTKRCYECNGHGHLARDCANKKTAKRAPPQAQNKQLFPQTPNFAPQGNRNQNQNFFPSQMNQVPQGNQNRNSGGPPQNSRGCYECGEIGHFGRDCAKRAQRLASQGTGQQGNFGVQGRRDPSACNNCGIVGHYGRDCPNKNRGNFGPPPRQI